MEYHSDNTFEAELNGRLTASLLRKHVFMKNYTTLRLGGYADYLLEVSNTEDAAECLRLAAKWKVPLFVMGRGSNLLVPDEGFHGIILHFGDAFSTIGIDDHREEGQAAVHAQAGVSLLKLSKTCAEASLSGLEFVVGIPGSVGGAVCMNAGAYGGEIKDVIKSVTLLYRDGHIETLSAQEMGFSYRQSLITRLSPSPVVTEAVFSLPVGNGEHIRALMRDYSARRREKQPVTLPSCGSTFKRPEGHYAAALIEQCGLKGYRVGGCSVSELHSGFLVNDREGTATDYLQLMRDVQALVYQKTGVRLEPEVRILRNRFEGDETL